MNRDSKPSVAEDLPVEMGVRSQYTTCTGAAPKLQRLSL